LNNSPKRQRSSIIGSVILLMLLCLITAGRATGVAVADDSIAALKQRLVSDGFEASRINLLYPPQFSPSYKTVSQTLRIRESKLDYAQFLRPTAIAAAKRFIRQYDLILQRAEVIYGVNRRVIAAILLVETHFGGYTGTVPTFAVLSTFALMDQEISRNRVWKLLPPQDQKQWERAEFDRKLMKRADWAYDELFALLHLTDGNPTQLAIMKGSIMGAIGWPQFLPSSLVRWGTDGDRDGRVDLFQPEDAIFSVANYLRAHGWDEAKTEVEKEEVIYTYNHSRPYVGAILGVAAALNEGSEASAVAPVRPESRARE